MTLDHERYRQEEIARRDIEDRDWRSDYAPRSHGCHEALHMASFLNSAVHDELLVHPAVLQDPEWYAMACRAADALFELYQAIGQKHL